MNNGISEKYIVAFDIATNDDRPTAVVAKDDGYSYNVVATFIGEAAITLYNSLTNTDIQNGEIK